MIIHFLEDFECEYTHMRLKKALSHYEPSIRYFVQTTAFG